MENKKYRILLVHNYYKYPGGEGIVVENEKQMLEENGHFVYVYSRSNNEIDEYNIFQKILLPINCVFNIKTYCDIKKIIKKNNIDIVHIHNTINIISNSVYFAANKCKAPVVQTIHNFRFVCPNGLFFRNRNICEECIENNLLCSIIHKCYRNSFFETLLSVINIKIIRNSGLLRKINYICLTEFNKRKLLTLNTIKKSKLIDERRVYIKPNFVENIVNDFVKPKNRDDYYLFASRLDESKGIKILLQAWKNIKDKKLLVCGSGIFEEWCKTFIKENKMNNVIFMGQVENRELINLMSKSQATIFLTKLYEGMPLTIIESFSVGTPVIVSNIGNAANMVEDGINGYKCNVNNIDEIREVIDKKLRKGMYSNAYNEYLNKYTKKNNYEILISIYRKAIENK